MPSSASSATPRPPASGMHTAPSAQARSPSERWKGRSQPASAPWNAGAAPLRTCPRTSGVTIRQVIAGRKKLVPSVSPPMLDSPQNGTVSTPRNIAQPIAPFSTTLITNGTRDWPSHRKRRCSALSCTRLAPHARREARVELLRVDHEALVSPLADHRGVVARAHAEAEAAAVHLRELHVHRDLVAGRRRRHMTHLDAGPDGLLAGPVEVRIQSL